MDRWVKALIVFVGDWKIKNSWTNTDARVLSERQLETYFLRQDQPTLTRAEVELISSHLARTVCI